MTRGALLAAAALTIAAPAAAQTIAIVNGRVAPMTGGAETIEGGTVLIQNGHIAAVGAGLATPPGARVIDAHGGWVTPGLFAGLSNLGVSEVFEGVAETNDARSPKSPFNAALDLAPAVNPSSIHIPITRIAGITRAGVGPENGNSLFAGQGLVLDLGQGSPAITRARAFQYVDLSQGGGQLAGGSRPAVFAAFRNSLREAQLFARNPAAYPFGRETNALITRRDVEALVPVVEGRQPLFVEVNRAQDILNVLGLRAEFPALRLVLVDAYEGWRVAPAIAAAGVPVITQALEDLPQSFDSLGATEANVGRMVRAGVTVALSGFGAGTNIQPRKLPQDAGNLVAIGRLPGGPRLSHAEALALLTTAPARIFGLSGVLGSLAPGKIADVVVWSGDPLEVTNAPTAVIIDGREQPLTSRQTELRDRYLGDPGGLTRRYKH